MGYWRTTTVEETPVVNIINWTIYEVSSPLWEGRSRHIIGYNTTEREGRCSSEIISFDKQAQSLVTSSGRVYVMVGKPGYSGDASYVWEFFSKNNQLYDITDITAEYINE